MTTKKRRKLGPVIKPPVTARIEYFRRLRQIAKKIKDMLNGVMLESLSRLGVRKLIRGIKSSCMKELQRLSKPLALWFTADIDRRATRTLGVIIEQAGASVVIPKMPRSVGTLTQQITRENVKLIRSLGPEYFDSIERSINGILADPAAATQGEIYTAIGDAIAKRGKQLDRRVALIARDQTSKAFGALTRERSLSVGITQGVWIHSSAAKDPRPGHVAAGRAKLVFDLKKGAYIDNASATAKKRNFHYTYPGQEIECGCGYRPFIEGIAG